MWWLVVCLAAALVAVRQLVLRLRPRREDGKDETSLLHISKQLGNYMLLVGLAVAWEFPWPALCVLGALVIVFYTTWATGLLERLLSWYCNYDYIDHLNLNLPLPFVTVNINIPV
jgi:hypothetical protein